MEEHQERAKGTLREIRRLERVIRAKFRSPPDCVHLGHLIAQLSRTEGSFDAERLGGGYRLRGGGVGGSTRRIIARFVRACVLHPRSKAAERKIHAVWR